MKDMALTAEEAKAQYGDACCAPESDKDTGPKYPWGLGLWLDEAAMKKLGMEGLPQVGTDMMLVAKVRVTGVSSREREGGEKSETTDLQITAMELQPVAQDRMAAAAGKLYGS